MTYTLIARCGRTGALGIGATTYSLAVGGLCPAIRGSLGVLTSQAFVNPMLRSLGLNLLDAGHPAAQVLSLLREADPHIAYRQLAIVDRYGDCAAHTGVHTRAWSGHRTGEGYVALGNVLAGNEVVDAMAEAFNAEPNAELAERLLKALEAGRDSGGQVGGGGHLPERSAALIVHGLKDIAEIDLRVDSDLDAVSRLRELYTEYRPYVAFHRLRWRNPANAPPQELFVASLTESER